MLNSVRGYICNSEVGRPRRIYEPSMITQVRSGLARNQALLVIVALVIIRVMVGVIFPALWSGKKTRRTAALDVLDCIVRWRRLTPAGRDRAGLAGRRAVLPRLPLPRPGTA